MNIKIKNLLGIFFSLFISHSLWSMEPEFGALTDILKIDEWEKEKISILLLPEVFTQCEVQLKKHLVEAVVDFGKDNIHNSNDLAVALFAYGKFFVEDTQLLKHDVQKSVILHFKPIVDEAPCIAAWRSARKQSIVVIIAETKIKNALKKLNLESPEVERSVAILSKLFILAYISEKDFFEYFKSSFYDFKEKFSRISNDYEVLHKLAKDKWNYEALKGILHILSFEDVLRALSAHMKA